MALLMRLYVSQGPRHPEPKPEVPGTLLPVDPQTGEPNPLHLVEHYSLENNACNLRRQDIARYALGDDGAQGPCIKRVHLLEHGALELEGIGEHLVLPAEGEVRGVDDIELASSCRRSKAMIVLLNSD